MATTTIPWGDGSGDNIYLTYSASQGDQTVLVSSDANGGAARQKVITFVSSVGNISRSLTVLQESGMDLVSITWNDVCITYNDTAIAYPYEEEYIVFVDSEVERICATTWGDGVGIKPSQAAQVTRNEFGDTFKMNTDITSFDELRYFTNVTRYNGSTHSFFQGCTNLRSVTLPPGFYAYIYSFRDCTNLEEVTILSSDTYFSRNSFYNATSVSKVHVPNIDVFLFRDREEHVSNTDSPFQSSVAASRGIYIDGQLVTSVVIPNGTTIIKGWTFDNINTLTSITIPNTITTINAGAFRNCTGIAGNVTLPSTLTSIGDYAFYGCNMLSSLVIPSSVSSITNTNFQGGDSSENSMIIVNCDVVAITSSITINYKKVYLNGSVDLHAKNVAFYGYGTCEELRISGDITNIGGYSVYGLMLNASSLKFCEVMGEFGTSISYGNIGATGIILHLGYDGIASTASRIFTSTRWAKIYVGDGSSASHDDAILAQYLADSDWATHASILDTWYNYSGEYKN